MRFVFTPPATSASGLLDLPWEQPLEDVGRAAAAWRSGSAACPGTRPLRGGGRGVYALKELDTRLARREYRLLAASATSGCPPSR